MTHAPSATRQFNPAKSFHPFRWLISVIFLALAVAALPQFSAAQLPQEIIGRAEGLDFTFEPPPGAPPAIGEATDQLISGSRITVRSGQARIILQDGGEILICGAARLQLLKARGAITIALDYGTVRMHIESSSPLAIYTPQVIVTTVAVGGARDATIGLDQDGRMCIRAALGAVRVQQQFGDQTLLVPQFGALSLAGTQITPVSATAPGCTCNLDAAKLYPPHVEVTVGVIGGPKSTSSPNTPAGANARNSPVPSPVTHTARTAGSTNAAVPPVVEDPVYLVEMPTLRFDASSPEPPPDTSADTFLLVRTAVVHGEVVYRGSVVPGKNHPTKLLAAQADPIAGPQSSRPGLMARISGFFRKLFGG
ncbi:MAG TPA: hypothetical protein VLV89_14095 [Candidatus Acidoferrum sp.]|nr:hypothetical protein [Candidatus Acidoferrum sp.]